jgi:hypothetical protein
VEVTHTGEGDASGTHSPIQKPRVGAHERVDGSVNSSEGNRIINYMSNTVKYEAEGFECAHE